MQIMADQAFEALVKEIGRAVVERGFNAVWELAQRLGMTGGRAGSPFTLGYRFQGTDQTGALIDLYVRSYDPSGPGQNEPDISRFTVTVQRGGTQVAYYDAQYEEHH
jgi:hypothetical protein